MDANDLAERQNAKHAKTRRYVSHLSGGSGEHVIYHYLPRSTSPKERLRYYDPRFQRLRLDIVSRVVIADLQCLCHRARYSFNPHCLAIMSQEKPLPFIYQFAAGRFSMFV